MPTSLPALSFDGSTVIAVGAVLARNWQALPTLRTEVDVILHAPGAEQKTLACVPVLQTLAPIMGQMETALAPRVKSSVPVDATYGAAELSELGEQALYASAGGNGFHFDPAQWINLITTLLPLIRAVTGK